MTTNTKCFKFPKHVKQPFHNLHKTNDFEIEIQTYDFISNHRIIVHIYAYICIVIFARKTVLSTGPLKNEKTERGLVGDSNDAF